MASTSQSQLPNYGTLSIPRDSTLPIHHSRRTRFSAISTLGDVYGRTAPDPHMLLNALISTLKQNNIAGPQLFRLKAEFTEELGGGAQCEVRAIGKEQLKVLRYIHQQAPEHAINKIWPVNIIAIKKHLPIQRDSARSRVLPTHVTGNVFGHNLATAKREIDALSHPPFRTHQNLVRLFGWGFCLDAIEDETRQSLQIPVLVLERGLCNLHQFLKNPTPYLPTSEQKSDESQTKCAVSDRQLRNFLRDIGSGLGALHHEGVSHGDLKSENILVFRKARARYEYMAKICDFGHARGFGNAGVGPDEICRYYGTPGWLPPEALDQEHVSLQPSSLPMCDIYAYGLLAWSVLTKDGAPPLDQGHDREGTSALENPLETATREIALRSFGTSTPYFKQEALLLIKGSLICTPKDRSVKPWSHLESYWDSLRVLNSPRASKDILAAFKLPETTSISLPQFKLRFTDVFSTVSGQPARCHKQIPASVKRQAYATFVDSGRRSENEAVSITPVPEQYDGTAHTTFEQCIDMDRVRSLQDRLLSAITSNRADKQIEIYCLARHRSRMKLCCWRGLCSGNPVWLRRENMLETALCARPLLEFTTMAWLCRGPVGMYEVGTLGSAWNAPWRLILGESHLNESEKLERFLLLLQHGAHVGYRPISGAPILQSYLQTCRTAIAATVIMEIRKRFEIIKDQPYVDSATRESILGDCSTMVEPAGSPNKGVENPAGVFNTISRYLFPVTTKVSVVETSSHSDDSLLEPACESTKVALGWRQIKTNKGSAKIMKPWWSRLIPWLPDRVLAEMPNVSCYLDEASGSVTMIPPLFSFFTERKITLGYQDLRGGQSYYLDVDGFVAKNMIRSAQAHRVRTMGDRFPFYDDQWYTMESHHEHFEDDVLGAIKDKRTLNMPQLPQLPSFQLPAIPKIPSFAAQVDAETLIGRIVWILFYVFIINPGPLLWVFLFVIWILLFGHKKDQES